MNNQDLYKDFKYTLGLQAMYNRTIGYSYNIGRILEMNIQFDRMWVDYYGKL